MEDTEDRLIIQCSHCEEGLKKKFEWVSYQGKRMRIRVRVPCIHCNGFGLIATRPPAFCVSEEE